MCYEDAGDFSPSRDGVVRVVLVEFGERHDKRARKITQELLACGRISRVILFVRCGKLNGEVAVILRGCDKKVTRNLD